VIAKRPLGLRSAAVVATAVLGLVAAAAPAGADRDDGTAAAIGGPAFTHVVGARLSGGAEVDAMGNGNQGDLTATGMVNIVVEQGSGAAGHPPSGSDVCVRIVVAGLGSAPIAAHIHKAAAGANGSIVVTLPTPVAGTSSGCVEVTDTQLLDDIALNPASYYVNVHTTAFPNGAVRGQLAEVPSPVSATLSGAAVLNASGTGGQGDPDGVGQIELLVDPGGEICFATDLSGIDAPTSLELDTTGFSGNGPILWTSSSVPALGVGGGCSTVSAAAASAILANPASHAVVVRTGTFPGGALRGQARLGLTSLHATQADGKIWTFGDATDLGSTAGAPLTKPIVGMATTPSRLGYWLVATDGGIFSFGDATFLGSTGAITLNQPIVGMAATPTGKGYWLVASDGGIFSYGDATFFGSTGAITLNQPIVGMAATPTGRGYWLVASDGGIFSFGDAAFFGSTGAITLVQPIVGMAATPHGHGYWLAAADGGVFTFGDATFLGSAAGRLAGQDAFVSIQASPMGLGYRMVSGQGQVSSFGDAPGLGSVLTGFLPLDPPVVGAA
jgi:hypothetical protein